MSHRGVVIGLAALALWMLHRARVEAAAATGLAYLEANWLTDEEGLTGSVVMDNYGDGLCENRAGETYDCSVWLDP